MVAHTACDPAIDTEEKIANAKLIAKAPEMFELLNDYLANLDCYCNYIDEGKCSTCRAEDIIKSIED
jgi:hypothetical protein